MIEKIDLILGKVWLLGDIGQMCGLPIDGLLLGWKDVQNADQLPNCHHPREELQDGAMAEWHRPPFVGRSHFVQKQWEARV
ncbi:hypothetical protein GIY21_02785 [Xanthomonas sontii]|uniref:Uncharacterized protein n=1 Tax=Xanthomonas sontii TaxID=2650745 RepID=A0A6N7Q5L5_9XANT|nr:hypothetical protein [Xanthomonas sontii]MRG99209.1 hypothetical protein [Xanthomonas sontii]MRH73541.1 hypothetical protein [Xanthomonas sontii]